MDLAIQGTVFKIGDNVNTDYIIPARFLDVYDPVELGAHALEGLGVDYPARLRGHQVLVAGENLGLGSAREQAPNALKGAGIRAVVAKSAARIFFRNAINVGLPVICCPAAGALETGHSVRIHLGEGWLEAPGGRRLTFTPFAEPVVSILRAGGMLPFLRQTVAAAAEKRPGAGGR